MANLEYEISDQVLKYRQNKYHVNELAVSERFKPLSVVEGIVLQSVW